MSRKRKRWPKIQICCSGGGTKGAAQAGSLQAIHEVLTQNLKCKSPACYTGASIGSINAAWYALEKDPQELKKLWSNLKLWNVLCFRLREIIFLLSVLLASVVAGCTGHWYVSVLLKGLLIWHIITLPGWSSKKNLEKTLRRHFGNAKISDCKHRLVIYTTDILSGGSIAYDSLDVNPEETDLVTLLLRSASFPGVFVPENHASGLLADGGVVNNVPVLNHDEFDGAIILTLGSTGERSKKIRSWIEVVFKVIDAMMFDDAKESLARMNAKKSLTIHYPFLYNRGTFDFSGLGVLYDKGYLQVSDNQEHTDKIEWLFTRYV